MRESTSSFLVSRAAKPDCYRKGCEHDKNRSFCHQQAESNRRLNWALFSLVSVRVSVLIQARRGRFADHVCAFTHLESSMIPLRRGCLRIAIVGGPTRNRRSSTGCKRTDDRPRPGTTRDPSTPKSTMTERQYSRQRSGRIGVDDSAKYANSGA